MARIQHVLYNTDSCTYNACISQRRVENVKVWEFCVVLGSLRYAPITKILENPFTVFLVQKKPLFLAGDAGLFPFFPSFPSSQSPFFLFAFLLYLSDPTSICVPPHPFPHTATSRQQHERYPSPTYIRTLTFEWENKEISSYTIPELPQRFPIIPSQPPPFSLTIAEKSP